MRPLRSCPAPGLRLRRLGAFASCALLLLFAAGCKPPAPPAPDASLALSWRVAPDPPVEGDLHLSFELTDTATKRPVAGATARIEANMSHPGMAPVLATAREVAPGRYESELDLTMAGDWFLLVELDLPDGRTLSRQIDLPGVRSRPGPAGR